MIRSPEEWTIAEFSTVDEDREARIVSRCVSVGNELLLIEPVELCERDDER